MRAGRPRDAAASADWHISFGPEARVDPPRQWGQQTNVMRTAKYTPWNFAVKNCYEQLQKRANVYFLCLTVLMWLGEHTCLYVDSIKAWSTGGLLFVMMSVSAVVAALDDVKRHKSDHEVNYQRSARLIDNHGRAASIPWAQVRPGDILDVLEDEEIPADLIALSCSDPRGLCYVSTLNLDGETNLKIKETVWQSSGFSAPPSGEVVAAPPSADLYSFTGTLVGDSSGGHIVVPLSVSHILMKGTRVRLTARCRGVVVYVGEDTRMQRNAQPIRAKLPNIEKVINTSMWTAIALQAILAALSAFAYTCTRGYFLHLPYLYPRGYESKLCLPEPVSYFLTFFVLYSNLVPVSLYATMEVCNAAFALFIRHDVSLRETCSVRTQERPRVRATNLCHELGQVTHVLSDKTGTLTENVMELHSIWPTDASTPLARDAPSGAFADTPTRRMLCTVLLLCHDAHRNEKGEIVASSAEEVAFLTGIEAYGWRFAARTGSSTRIETPVPGATVQTYDLLAMNKFDSTRKCMSVVVENVDTRERWLFVKGADTALLGADRCQHHPAARAQQARADECSRVGHRAMLAAWRPFNGAACDHWLERYVSAARGASASRTAILADLAGEVETPAGLEIAGVLSIEDKLQQHVPETVTALRRADIRVWLLTGDCSGTAEAVARAACIVDASTTVLRFTDGCSWAEVVAVLARKAYHLDAALIVGGRELEKLRADERESFVEVCLQMQSVVACRVTPAQKAELVRITRGVSRKRGAAVTLAIGDGANDVAMIQEAQIGIGIMGREGMHAANCADFAIGEFACMERLLLVHGHWSLRRSSQVVLLSFWRNAVQELMMCYYTFASGFSGTPLFEDRIRITFNMLCTLPLVGLGVFEQSRSSSTLLQMPSIYYQEGRNANLLAPRAMLSCLGHAAAHSLIITSVVAAALEPLHAAALGDYWSVCVVAYTLLVLGCNYQVAFASTTWNPALLLSHALSVLLYALFLGFYNGGTIPGSLASSSAWTYHVPQRVFASPVMYFCAMTSLLGQYITDSVGRCLLSTAPSPPEPDVARCGGPPRHDVTRPAGRAPTWWVQFQTQEMPAWRSRPLLGAELLCAAGLLSCLLAVVAGAGTFQARTIVVPYGPHSNSSTQSLNVPVQNSMPGPVLVSYVIAPFFQNFNSMRANLRLLSGSEFNDTFAFPGYNLSFDHVAWSSDVEMLRSARAALGPRRALAAWVRADVGPRVEKRYGWLENGVATGNLQVLVRSHYDAAALGASKQLVLSARPRIFFGCGLAVLLLTFGLPALLAAQLQRSYACHGRRRRHQPLASPVHG